MKVDVGTVLIKMVEVICVWRVVSGVNRNVGSEHSVFMQPTFLSTQNLPKVLWHGCADLRGDTLVK